MTGAIMGLLGYVFITTLVAALLFGPRAGTITVLMWFVFITAIAMISRIICAC